MVDRPEDVEQALKDAFGKYKDKLVFLDFHVDPTENVWPMGESRTRTDGNDLRLGENLMNRHVLSIFLENEREHFPAWSDCSPLEATTLNL